MPPCPRHLVGRVQVKDLEDWKKQGDVPLLFVCGPPGCGKTSLVLKWMQSTSRGAGASSPQPIWWSFGDNPSFARYLLALSHYFQVEALLDDFRSVVNRIAQALRAYRGLVVIDGIDQVNEPQGLGKSPGFVAFLQMLLKAEKHTRVLLTSHKIPEQIKPLSGWVSVEVGCFKDTEAFNCIQVQNKRGLLDKDVRRICRAFGNVPLSLHLAATLLNEDPSLTVDGIVSMSEASLATVAASIKSLEDCPAPHQVLAILQRSLEGLESCATFVLTVAACFRGASPYNDIVAIVGSNRHWGPSDIQNALRILCMRGILFENPKAKEYHIHPLVRRFAYTTSGEHSKLHRAIAEHLQSTIHARTNTIDAYLELFHHLAKAGLWEKALLVYRTHLESLHLINSNATISLELLREFYPAGFNRAPPVKSLSDRGYVCNGTGVALLAAGDLPRSEGEFVAAMSCFAKARKTRNWVIKATNLAHVRICRGKLTSAEELLRDCFSCQIGNNALWRSVPHRDLSTILALMARFDEAREQIDVARQLLSTGKRKEGASVREYYAAGTIEQDEAYMHLLNARYELACGRTKAAARHATLATEGIAAALRLQRSAPGYHFLIRNECASTLIVAAANLFLGIAVGGHRNCSTEHCQAALRHLDIAQQMCSNAELLEMELQVGLCRSRVHLEQGRISDSQVCLEKVLSVATSCRYELVEIEGQMTAALLAIRKGDRVSAMQLGTQARLRAEQSRYMIAWVEGGAILETATNGELGS